MRGYLHQIPVSVASKLVHRKIGLVHRRVVPSSIRVVPELIQFIRSQLFRCRQENVPFLPRVWTSWLIRYGATPRQVQRALLYCATVALQEACPLQKLSCALLQQVQLVGLVDDFRFRPGFGLKPYRPIDQLPEPL